MKFSSFYCSRVHGVIMKCLMSWANFRPLITVTMCRNMKTIHITNHKNQFFLSYSELLFTLHLEVIYSEKVSSFKYLRNIVDRSGSKLYKIFKIIFMLFNTSLIRWCKVRYPLFLVELKLSN